MYLNISNYDYKFFIIDSNRLEVSMKKISSLRTKNILSFWEKNIEHYITLCKEGSLFPIQDINSGEFSFYINEENIPNNWSSKRAFSDFYFNIQPETRLWIVSDSELYNWKYNNFKESNQITIEIDGDSKLIAHRIELEIGTYELNISVLNNMQYNKQEKELPEFGFLINFKRVNIKNIENYPTEFDFNGRN